MDIIALIKSSLVPGSVGFLLFACTAAALLLYGPPRIARWGRRGLAALVLMYWLLSVPPVALRLEAGVTYRDESSDRRLNEATTIVVLGAGSLTCSASGGEINLPTQQTAFSALEAVRLYRLLDRPLVIASGGAPIPEKNLRAEGEVIREVLVRLGIPDDRILVEQGSLNTHDQAVNVARIIRDRQLGPFALVASKTHMPRALALFRAQGLDPIPAGSALRSEGVSGWTARPWPNLEALEASRMVAYHYLATAYAWAKGWTDQTAISRVANPR